jgi:hypothetical protein
MCVFFKSKYFFSFENGMPIDRVLISAKIVFPILAAYSGKDCGVRCVEYGDIEVAPIRILTCSDSIWIFSMVGPAGFEPTTPCTPCKCASQAALRPDPIEGSRSSGWGVDFQAGKSKIHARSGRNWSKALGWRPNRASQSAMRGIPDQTAARPRAMAARTRAGRTCSTAVSSMISKLSGSLKMAERS